MLRYKKKASNDEEQTEYLSQETDEEHQHQQIPLNDIREALILSAPEHVDL